MQKMDNIKIRIQNDIFLDDQVPSIAPSIP